MGEGQARQQLYFPALEPLYDKVQGYAYPLIRFVAGAFLVPHGAQKLFEWFGGSTAGTAAFFSKLGLEPALPLVYLTGAVEFFCGILIAIGLFTRVAAGMAFVMLTVAWYTVHLGNGFFWTKAGIEYPLLWSLLMVVILLRGSGRMSVDEKIGKEV
jgi:putative oxidoreductase